YHQREFFYSDIAGIQPESPFFGNADFTEVTFSGDADFGQVQFFGEVEFEKTEFFKKANFYRTTFLKLTYFRYVQTSKTSEIQFREVRLPNPELVKFHRIDLSRWSFLDTDLRRIDFDDVTWGTIRRLWSRRTAIFDELGVSNKKVKEDLAKVERLYRHLKQNFESQRDYGRAGEFHYGEMEMKRRQLGPVGQIPFWIYRILSGYGESYGRALIVLLGMWIVFAVLFTVVGYTDEWGNHADLWRSLIYSAQSMTLFHEPNITFHNVWGKAIELVASVLGVIQIALFGLALQRRFKR
ncbi:MAG: pentapeptide repeat-containing protein, partial [Candidatus Bipolaricaulota bacterium]|nr:pentapeptide repeat-containing protein [Candidatus Bipolaricaulota bacterium]